MPATVLYDRDCGFCRVSVSVLLVWDRKHEIRPVAIQSAEGERLLSDLTQAQRLDSWHLVEAQTRSSAGAAFAPLLSQLPGGAPLAALADRVPGTTERAYRWVARHRGPLGSALPPRLKRRADRLIANREHAVKSVAQ